MPSGDKALRPNKKCFKKKKITRDLESSEKARPCTQNQISNLGSGAIGARGVHSDHAHTLTSRITTAGRVYNSEDVAHV